MNTDLVKYADDRTTSTVLTTLDGESFVISGGLADWLKAVTSQGD